MVLSGLSFEKSQFTEPILVAGSRYIWRTVPVSCPHIMVTADAKLGILFGVTLYPAGVVST